MIVELVRLYQNEPIWVLNITNLFFLFERDLIIKIIEHFLENHLSSEYFKKFSNILPFSSNKVDSVYKTYFWKILTL